MTNSSTKNILSSIPASVLKVGALLSVVVLVVWALPKHNQQLSYKYEEGRVWTYPTLIAEFDFPIYKPDSLYNRQLSEAMQAYAPCFVAKGSVGNMYVLSAADMQMLIDNNYNYIHYINRRHISSVIPLTDIYTPRSAYEKTQKEWSPNLEFDSITSQKLYDNIHLSVSPTEGAVLHSQTIIEYGEVVDAQTCLILQSLERTLKDKDISERHRFNSTAATSILIFFFISCFAAYLIIFRKSIWQQKRAVLFFSVVTALMTVGTAFVLRFFASSPTVVYAIPFVWIPILIRVFYDSRTAFILHITNVFVVSLMMNEPFLFILLQIPAGMVAVVALKDLTRRAQLAITAVYVLITYTAIYSLYYLMLTGTIANVSWHPYLCFAINAVLIIGVYTLIYIFEKMFRLLSSITLIELSNLNSDLMHTFADKAPGTFQHSLQVSSLASDAAKSIGAKALLVRTAALYHDIGKMTHADNYTENQAEGHNPLLLMTNSEAAQAVIAHVTEGVRLARRNGLPEIIINFIKSHHGTTLVRYFYNSEVNRLRQENPEAEKELNLSDYQYPGPRPATKEEAILMMADAVEARARSLNSYTEESLREMVEQMVTLQMQDGQFALTPLTFSDVERIKQSFCERLLSIHHHRIQYPTIKG